ncbi:hypothetical protein [Aquitalea pelogenes]|uniref:hypothetical protein n=1 Tax=Aquitalea pelogenes TaxID=1293573 RepID=UPI0035B28C74
MKITKYYGIENCTTCIGESNEWTLLEYEELGLIKFYESNNSINANALVLNSVKNNEFFLSESNNKISVFYNSEQVQGKRFEKVELSRDNNKIFFKTENRTIEFTMQ